MAFSAPGGAGGEWCLNPAMALWHATSYAAPPGLQALGFGPVQTSMGNCPYAHAPRGFTTNSSYSSRWSNKSWEDPSTGIVHMFHGNGNRWGNWQFALENLTVHDEGIEAYFRHGGWQGRISVDFRTDFRLFVSTDFCLYLLIFD